MYSSVSEAEYQFRRTKAEEEAREAYGRSGSSQSRDPHVRTHSVQPRDSHSRLESSQMGNSHDDSDTFRFREPGDSDSRETVSSGVLMPGNGRGLGGILSRLKEDDVLLIAILFLLFNENKDDDPLIVMILAVLLFT